VVLHSKAGAKNIGKQDALQFAGYNAYSASSNSLNAAATARARIAVRNFLRPLKHSDDKKESRPDYMAPVIWHRDKSRDWRRLLHRRIRQCENSGGDRIRKAWHALPALGATAP